jgi:hypothetical protein
MTRLVLTNILRFVALIVLQVLMLNYVYMGGYVVPFIYILAIMMLPTQLGNIPLLLIAFASGGLVDLFCNIPGFHMFSCTMMAFFRILFGNKMLTRDDPTEIVDVPSVRSVPFEVFAMYVLLMALVYSVTYGLLETFSFGNFGMTAISMAVNTVVAWILVMLCQLLIKDKSKN